MNKPAEPTDVQVRLTKHAACKNPVTPTPEMRDYRTGEDNGDVSLPTNYSVEGTLIPPLKAGFPLNILRSKRNGVVCSGYTSTSPIQRIDEGNGKLVLTTQNSIYTLEYL